MEQKLNAEDKAYASFTSASDNPFSSYQPDSTIPKTTPPPTPSAPTPPKYNPAQNNLSADNIKAYQQTQNSSASVPAPVAPVNKSYLDTIKSVFGSSWTSSLPTNIQSKGILGAVRVAGTPTVFILGQNGASGVSSPEMYKSIFGDLNQQGRVGEITAAQARALKIAGY